MRIYYLSGSPLPSVEANCVNVTRMCSAFARQGHEVQLFARRTGPGDEAELLRTYGVSGGVRLHLLSNPRRWAYRKLAYPLAVLAVLRRLPRPDVFYGRDIYSTAWAALTMPGVPVAYEAHELPARGLRRRLERWLFHRSSFTTVFAISDALKDDYRERYPEVDLALARDAADEPAAPPALPDLGGRPGVRRVGYVGHLYPGKGMETVAALAERMPALDFHVVGGREAELAAWRDSTAHLSNLKYHGFVEHAQVPAYMAAMDVLLAPPLPVTRSAGGRDIGRWMSPLKIFEYMAAGRPIVASDIPAVREILRDGETALIVPARDIDAWVSALQRLEDPRLASHLAGQARADLLQRYTWTARSEAITTYLAPRLGLLASRNRRARPE